MGHKLCGVLHARPYGCAFGGIVAINAVRADNSRRKRVKAFTCFWRRLSQRAFRPVIECGYDALAWACGLVAAAWVTRDLATMPGAFTMIRAFLAICLLSAGAGLLAGLYRGRYQRGSLDEVMGVGISASTMTLLVTLVSPALVTGERAALLTVAGGVVFAVPAMLGGRYVLFAVRQRSRSRHPRRWTSSCSVRATPVRS